MIDCKAGSLTERRACMKICSCWVQSVAVHSRERTLFKASGSRSSSCKVGSFLDFWATKTAFQITPLFFSHWLLPLGLYKWLCDL